MEASGWPSRFRTKSPRQQTHSNRIDALGARTECRSPWSCKTECHTSYEADDGGRTADWENRRDDSRRADTRVRATRSLHDLGRARRAEMSFDAAARRPRRWQLVAEVRAMDKDRRSRLSHPVKSEFRSLVGQAFSLSQLLPQADGLLSLPTPSLGCALEKRQVRQ